MSTNESAPAGVPADRPIESGGQSGRTRRRVTVYPCMRARPAPRGSSVPGPRARRHPPAAPRVAATFTLRRRRDPVAVPDPGPAGRLPARFRLEFQASDKVD